MLKKKIETAAEMATNKNRRDDICNPASFPLQEGEVGVLGSIGAQLPPLSLGDGDPGATMTEKRRQVARRKDATKRRGFLPLWYGNTCWAGGGRRRGD